MIKKIVSGIIAIIMMLSFSSCSDSERENVVFAGEENNEQAERTTDSQTNDTVSGTAIDPFNGLSVSFEGASPFCTILINNSKCSEDVQNDVVYSLEKDTITTEGSFSAGDTVTLYASLRSYYGVPYNSELSLISDENTYVVSGVDEYITDFSQDLKTEQLLAQEQDYLASITSWTKSDKRPLDIGEYHHYFDSYSNLKLESVYFCSLKTSSYSKYKNGLDYFNKFVFNYSINISAKSEVYGDIITEVRHISVFAKNIVLSPDGNIGWGINDPAALDFEYNWNATGQNDLIAENITSLRADYNVAEITELIKAAP